MIFFLYGADTYRAHQKLQEIIQRFGEVQRSAINLRYLDGKTVTYPDFLRELSHVGMFREKKLLVLTDFSLNRAFQESLKQHVKEWVRSPHTIVFYKEGDTSQKDPFFKFLKTHARSQEFQALEGPRLKNWIKREYMQYGVRVKPEIIDLLIQRVGNDLWRLSHEIKKVVSYALPKAEISEKDVTTLVAPVFEPDIFKTIDLIAQKKRRSALVIVHEHLINGSSPLYLLGMIHFQFRNILAVKHLIEKGASYTEIIQKSKLHPFVVRKSVSLSKKFQVEELKKIYQKIFQADLDIKTGKVDPETALNLLIAEI